MKRVLFVINPNAGSGVESHLQAALEERTEWLQPTLLEATGTPEDMRVHLKAHLEGTIAADGVPDSSYWDAVAIVGGDGTVMETLPVLLNYPQIPVMLVAGGTGNLLHANLNIPREIPAALDLIRTGQQRVIDVGEINGEAAGSEIRYFVLIAGIGVVADVMENTPRDHKKWFGPLAYLLHGIRVGLRLTGSRFTITTESKTYRSKALAVLISNAACYMGPCVPFTPEAKPNDGLLDVCIIRGGSVPDLLGALPSLLKPDSTMRDANVIRFQAKTMRITSRPALSFQADGNILGKTPADIRVLPDALRVLVPQDATVTENTLADSVKSLMGWGD